MLMASQRSKKGFSQANVPSAEDINAMLAANFTEYELQTMYSDLRFFFPLGKDDKTFSKLKIFHDLDIFEGEHFCIKEAYLQKQRKLKMSSQKKHLGAGLGLEDSYNDRKSENLEEQEDENDVLDDVDIDEDDYHLHLRDRQLKKRL